MLLMMVCGRRASGQANGAGENSGADDDATGEQSRRAGRCAGERQERRTGARAAAERLFRQKQGKPQAITFFEEHQIASGTEQETVALPPNVFSNHPDEPQPAAVTVLLLDALNAPVEDQSFVHQQALQFLKTARPGMRMAIFTMSSGLHFVQGHR